MSHATLTIDRIPHADNARAFVVDCEHGTTTITVFAAPDPAKSPPDTVHARLAVATHYAEEHCRCTRLLRRRFGIEKGARE